MGMRKGTPTAALLAVFLTGLLPVRAVAQDCDPWVARLVSLERRVEVKRQGTARWEAAAVGQTYCGGDQIRVGDNGRAGVELNNDTILRLDQRSLLILPQGPSDRLSFVELIKGALHLISRIKRQLEIRTPFVNAGLEGTEFVVRLIEKQALVSVIEGEVAVHNPLGRLRLVAGQSASASPGQAPVLRLDLDPVDAVHWAIHYPMITGATSPSPLAKAQTRLLVGRVEEARAAIRSLLAEQPQNADALALNAIVELAQNRRDRAHAMALSAVDVDETAAALTALSYVLQAEFDLEAARATAQRGTRLFADNALLWARLAELQLAQGETAAALDSARHAASLDPELARTQTVLGFAQMARIDIGAALRAFGRSIALDPADPISRLGLGLARIRQGQLTEGRRELEIAASLNPAGSLVRSYLGRAYLEERRMAEAGEAFDLAKRFDPLDPTAWLYSSQRNLAENRPAKSLSDITESIRLNGNRAVYRSRLLLDQDLATRTSSQGAIYRALGFEELGESRAEDSITTDPANFSAHYLLADAYTERPRHEVARASEEHLALRLSPPHAGLVQPQTTFSNLAIPRGTDMRAVSFNEFGRLYTTNGIELRLNALVGSNDTFSEEMILSGLQDRIGYSFGQFQFKTEGDRENNDLKHDIVSAFLNIGVSVDTHVQLAIQDRDTEFGDLSQQFDPTDFDPDDRWEIDENTVTLAAYHAVTPALAVVGSFSYIDRTEQNLIDDSLPTPLGPIVRRADLQTDIEGLDLELQTLYRRDDTRITAGLRHLDLDRSTRGEDTFFIPQIVPPLPFPVVVANAETVARDGTLSNSRGYVYLNQALGETAELTLGVSVDSLNDEIQDETEVHPKAGLVVDLSERTRLRVAAMRNLAPPVAAKRSLEPTQVAGFNQLYDDPNDTISERLGLGIDHQFSYSVFGGIELSTRDLDVPVHDSGDVDVPADDSGDIEEWGSEEVSHNAYINWLAGDQVTVRLGYTFEEIENASDWGLNVAREVSTHTLEGVIQYAHARGLIGALNLRHVNQSVDYAALSDQTSDQDKFWSVDASIGWRLPGRQGIIEFGVRNLLDEEFRYQHPYLTSDQPEPPSAEFQPERFWYVRGVVTF